MIGTRILKIDLEIAEIINTARNFCAKLCAQLQGFGVSHT